MNLSSLTDGESTVIGPEIQLPPTPPPLPQIKKVVAPKPKPIQKQRRLLEKVDFKKLEEKVTTVPVQRPTKLPPVRRTRRPLRGGPKSSPYYSSLMPAVMEKMRGLYTNIQDIK